MPKNRGTVRHSQAANRGTSPTTKHALLGENALPAAGLLHCYFPATQGDSFLLEVKHNLFTLQDLPARDVVVKGHRSEFVEVSFSSTVSPPPRTSTCFCLDFLGRAPLDNLQGVKRRKIIIRGGGNENSGRK